MLEAVLRPPRDLEARLAWDRFAADCTIPNAGPVEGALGSLCVAIAARAFDGEPVWECLVDLVDDLLAVAPQAVGSARLARFVDENRSDD